MRYQENFFYFRVVSVGLFAHHQLMFSFMLCANIMLAEGRKQKIAANEAESCTSSRASSGISELMWMTFLKTDIMASTADQEILMKHDGLYLKLYRVGCQC